MRLNISNLLIFTFVIVLAYQSYVLLKRETQIPQNDLIISNVTLLSPEREAPMENAYVYVQNGRIAKISDGPFALPAHVRQIDGRGLFLTPGLMDSHTHVTFVPGMGFDGTALAKQYSNLVEVYRQQQPRSWLYFGVTQVVDPSPAPNWQTFTDEPLHPDLFRCGALPNLDGYPQMSVPEAVRLFPNFIISNPSNFGLNIDIAQHMPESSVKAIAESGAICVKIYIENGFGADASLPIPSDDLIAQIKNAADEHGLLLYAHANAIDMAQIALRTDVDIFGHGLWNWNWDANDGPPPVQDVLNQITAKKVGYIPTFGILEGLQQLMMPDSLDNPLLKNVTPQVLLEWYKTDEAQWFKKELLSDFGETATPETTYKTFGYTINRAQQATAYLGDIGHPLALGSDFPGSPSYIKQPGLSTYQEILAMSEAGLSPRIVFEAATLNNAGLFNLEDKYGSIEVGKIANLLLLRQNPLNDVTAWDTIDTIILHGTAIERDSLKAQ